MLPTAFTGLDELEGEQIVSSSFSPPMTCSYIQGFQVKLTPTMNSYKYG